MRKITTEGFVIKNINLKDSDKLFTILTKERGKISAVAKGVRKITSRRGGSLDTLNKVLIQLNTSKSGYYYITEVTATKSYQNIKGNLEKIKQATYVLEFVNKTVYDESEEGFVFNLLEKVLDELNFLDNNIVFVVNKFELKMLKYLGYESPKEVLFEWRDLVKKEDFESANKIVKSYVREILQEDFKSLEF